MIVNVGFSVLGDYGVSFMFIYDADNASISQELVDLLIRSGSYGIDGELLKLGQFSGS